MRLFVGNDQTIRVSGAQDAESGDYLNNAVVEVVLMTRAGSQVAGQDWPLVLDYIADSQGDYKGNMDDAIQLVSGGSYVIEITITVAGGLKGFWRQDIHASYRKFGQ